MDIYVVFWDFSLNCVQLMVRSISFCRKCTKYKVLCLNRLAHGMSGVIPRGQLEHRVHVNKMK
jgi:hypothetical protein